MGTISQFRGQDSQQREITVTGQTRGDIVEEYLGQLRAELRLAPVSARDDYISEISQHITEGRENLAPGDIEGLRDLLARVGNPVVLANEYYESEGVDTTGVLRRMSMGRRMLLVSVPLGILLVLGFAIGALVWVTHYQPLTDGGQGAEGPLGPNGQVIRELPVSFGAQPFTVPVYAMPKGTSTLRILVYLYNTGGRPLIITGIQSPATNPHVFGPASYAYVDTGKGSQIGRTRFPFILRGHQWIGVVLSVPMHCTAANGESVEFTRARVTTSFFGVSHGVWISIGNFAVDFAKSC
jgi:hypothetical protein